MIPSDLSYDFPAAAYLILLSPVLLWLFWRLYVYRQNRLSMTALPNLISKRSAPLFWLRSFFFILAWIFAVLALMQPKGSERYPQGVQQGKKSSNQLTLQRKGHDIIILIDASASMGIPDARNKVTRLNDAKEIADEFISRLKGENVALYAFTSEPSKISPLTLDYLFARLMLKAIQINEGGVAGTNISKALTKVRQEYFSQPTPRLKTVILISDGGDTEIESLSGAQKEDAIGKLLGTLENADALNVRVYTIGVGSRAGGQVPDVTDNGQPVRSALDDSLLRRISGKGRGLYVEANQLSLVDLVSRIWGDMAQDSPFVDETTIQRSYSLETDQKIYTYYFYVPLFLALMCLLIALFLPETSFWTAVFLMSTATLQADDLPPYAAEKMIHAAREAEAGAYREAMDDYSSLSELPLEPWQRAIVTYNQGTLLVDEKKWIEAIQKLITITDPKDQPLLRRRLFTNLAIAQLEFGKEILRNPQNSRKAQFLLLRSQDSLNQAIKADCEVEILEGSKECGIPFDIREIELAIRQELSQVLSQVQKDSIKNATLDEGIAALYRGIDQLENHLKLEEAADHQLKDNYRAFIIASGDSWLPLWNALKYKINDPKNLAVYEEARKLYAYAIRFVEKGKPNMSRGGIIEARQKLDDFVKLQWGNDPVKVLLHRFEGELKAALDQNPLILSDITAVKDQWDRVMKAKQDMKLEPIQTDLNRAIAYLQADKQIPARMFGLSAQQYLNRQLKKNTNNPDLILEEAISQQQHAMGLNMLFLLLDANQQTDDVAELVKQAQQQTIAAADPYLSAVRDIQTNHYKELGECQCKPWDDVLPLFNSGFKEALRSRKQINEHIHETRLALISQDQTLKDWQAALNQFNKKVQEEKKPKEELQPEPAPNQKKQEEDKQLPLSTQAILQTLQDMQRADIKKKGEQPVTTEGTKPW